MSGAWAISCCGTIAVRRTRAPIFPRASAGGCCAPRSRARCGRIETLGASPLSLVENHHFGHESVHVSDMSEAAICGDAAEILLEIAPVVGLVIALRKEFEHAVIVGLIADLRSE